MISSATFHVISTELVVGSFAMAGLCFLLKTTYLLGFLKSDKLSLISDYAGHFALGFGLIATAFAIPIWDKANGTSTEFMKSPKSERCNRILS